MSSLWWCSDQSTNVWTQRGGPVLNSLFMLVQSTDDFVFAVCIPPPQVCCSMSICNIAMSRVQSSCKRGNPLSYCR